MSNFMIEEFSKYKVFLYAMDEEHAAVEAAIHIPLADGLAILRFCRGELDVNTAKKSHGKDLYEVHFRAERYSHFIDLLRHEQPMFFAFNYDTTKAYITTSDEPVGEGPIDTSD